MSHKESLTSANYTVKETVLALIDQFWWAKNLVGGIIGDTRRHI